MLVFKRGTSTVQTQKTNPAYLDQVNERSLLYLRQFLGHYESQKIWMLGQKILNLPERAIFYSQAVLHCEEQLRGMPSRSLQDFAQFRWKPVGVREFICRRPI